jgi:hypothetical protein
MTWDQFHFVLFNLLFFPYVVPFGWLVTSIGPAFFAVRRSNTYQARAEGESLAKPWVVASVLMLAVHIYVLTLLLANGAGLAAAALLFMTVAVQDFAVLMAFLRVARTRRAVRRNGLLASVVRPHAQ